MDDIRLVEGLREHTRGFAAAVAGADPESPVPTCPEWPLRVLVGHIGQAHRWSAGIVRSGPTPVPDPFDADPGGPEEWTGWLQAGAEDLIDAVRGSGGSPVWTFFGSLPARFWLRRMLSDLTVHYADAAMATGSEFALAPDLATDAIEEWLELVAHPVTPSIKPSVAELRGTGQTLQLRAGEGIGWLITRIAGGVQWTRATADADVTLTGPVADLLLALTRRLPLDQISVAGDRDLIEHWLAHTAA
ncbi:MAG TPA: maleylpyruvate isomerase family mycothiol-dependent enzyme [Mycobacteriales bacterium]|nr:maleylpyruvate isomerase family mycothiol-dependent enzyme [Mycobacteriales bacterium]